MCLLLIVEILYGYLYTLKGFLEGLIDSEFKDRALALLQIVCRIIDDTDFSVLYSTENI